MAEAERISEIARRLARVRKFRAASSEPSTRLLEGRPNRFYFSSYKGTPAVIVPLHTSERRNYVPMDFVGPETVISNAANAVYDAEPWLFALLHSRMHMTWIRAVAGRMKTDIRYSAVLVYNTFPVPDISDDQRATLTNAAVSVLATREQFSGQTLAQLYDPNAMPPVLSSAHRGLDDAVDALYQPEPFDSDVARLELLFQMYEAAVAETRISAHA